MTASPMTNGVITGCVAKLRIKRAHTALVRDHVYRLRYRTYLKEDAIEPSVFAAFEDRYDHQPNHVLWALTYEDKVIGSIRTTWFDPMEVHPIPEMHAYSDELAALVPRQARIMSGNRLVTDPDLSSTSAQTVLVLLPFHGYGLA